MPDTEPSRDCPACARLVAFRKRWRAAEPSWHNAPVPNFISPQGELLIVGLAPGLQGANRTGRPFTGDWAGDLLYETMVEFGFAHGQYEEHADDGLELVRTTISNAVRCVPPENKPTPQEILTCRPFLSNLIRSMADLKLILCLGRISHESTVRALGGVPSKFPFAHAAIHQIGGIALIDSYHCSRYNTNTGRLTVEMFRNVFRTIRRLLDEPRLRVIGNGD